MNFGMKKNTDIIFSVINKTENVYLKDHGDSFDIMFNVSPRINMLIFLNGNKVHIYLIDISNDDRIAKFEYIKVTDLKDFYPKILDIVELYNQKGF